MAAQLRRLGELLCASATIGETLQANLLGALAHGGGWPLRFPPEVLVFFARLVLRRLRANGAAVYGTWSF